MVRDYIVGRLDEEHQLIAKDQHAIAEYRADTEKMRQEVTRAFQSEEERREEGGRKEGGKRVEGGGRREEVERLTSVPSRSYCLLPNLVGLG